MHMQRFADFQKERDTQQTVSLFMIWRVSKMPHEVLFLFDFLNIEFTRMHELLMKVTGMRLETDFLAEVVVL